MACQPQNNGSIYRFREVFRLRLQSVGFVGLTVLGFGFWVFGVRI